MALGAALSFAPADVERRLGEIIRADGDTRPWLHGGKPGFRRGDILLPAALTGNLQGCAGKNNNPEDSEWVYISKDWSCPTRRAALYPGGGAVYAVNPIGQLVIDPYIIRLMATHPAGRLLYQAHLNAKSPLGIAFCCRAARVIYAMPPLDPQ